MKLVAGLGLIATLATGAPAQNGVSALKGHDSNAPVYFSAERLEVQDRADRAVLAGNVHVTQGELTLDTDRATLAYINAGKIQLRRLDAAGGVVVKSPTETARGAFAVYDLDRKLITMIGGVELLRGGSSIKGQRLVIDLDSGRAVVDGGPAGVGQSGGRVTGHFIVPQRAGR
jgi:lipopolysaccharide export system protein LptA